MITNLIALKKKITITSSVNGFDYNFYFTYDDQPCLITPYYSLEEISSGIIVFDHELTKINIIKIINFEDVQGSLTHKQVKWLLGSQSAKISPVAELNNFPSYLYNAFIADDICKNNFDEQREAYEITPAYLEDDIVVYPSAYIKISNPNNRIYTLDTLPSLDSFEKKIVEKIANMDKKEIRANDITKLINSYRKIKLGIIDTL